MTQTPRAAGAGRAAVLAGRLPLLLVLGCAAAPAAWADPPAVVDSQSIVRSLKPAPATRGLMVAPRTGGGAASASSGGGAAGSARKVTLDIRFASDSDRLTAAAHAQLDQLGAALNSPELARNRFLIAGHTSATGPAEHNLQLSQARAQAARAYLLERFQISPDRIEATGYGSSRPLADFPPNALQQRRVEISTLPP
jgi:OmpA-OmpF porin, OOP family